MSIPHSRLPHPQTDMLIGALLRVPAQAIHRRIIADSTRLVSRSSACRTSRCCSSRAGWRPPGHTRRARRHEQTGDEPAAAEPRRAGYLVRSDAPDEGRARIVRLTKRGRAAYGNTEILRDIEHEWSAELGPKHFTELKELLLRVWESPLIR